MRFLRIGVLFSQRTILPERHNCSAASLRAGRQDTEAGSARHDSAMTARTLAGAPADAVDRDTAARPAAPDTPADAAMMMQLGADGVFVGSGIFKSGNPEARAKAIVKATAFYNDPEKLADASRGLGEAMVGINVADLPAPHRLAERGW